MGINLFLLDPDNPELFPNVEYALREPNGLLAMGGDLSPARLLAAYRRGIFPWFNPEDPILWWSPDPRTVLIPGNLKVSRSLRKSIRNKPVQVRFDTAFADVISQCGEARREGTWITPELKEAYNRLFEMGYGHSVETWLDGELVGGLYGIAIGHVFFGESMFSKVSDSSKIALAALDLYLATERFAVIDCQVQTTHLLSLGAVKIPRVDFVQLLTHCEDDVPPSHWQWTDTLDKKFRA